MNRRFVARALVLLALLGVVDKSLGAASLRPPEQPSAQRMVFAHYMLSNQDYVPANAPPEVVIASYQREILQAQKIGIDGFALNAGGWLREPRYILRASEMFEAAYQLHTHFKLMFSADMCCSNDAADLEDMVRRFANNPRYRPICFTRDGSFVLTTFAGSKLGPQFWQSLRSDLEKGTHPSQRDVPKALVFVSGVPSSAPLRMALVPAFFWGGELPHKSDIEDGMAEYRDIIDGSFYWGIAAVPGLGRPPDQVPSSVAYSSVLHAAGKIYMAPICFQFWGANANRYYEYSGYAGMRKLWMNAINVTHPEWVEIITWNDFVEGTYVSPIDDPAKYPGANDLGNSVVPPSTLNFFHTHSGAAELLAFYIRWYKTGTQPPIQADSIFWAYRTEATSMVAAIGHGLKVYGPLADKIYVTANLKASAVLRVSVAGQSKSFSLPPGSSDIEVPYSPGTSAPDFQLIRGTTTLVEDRGADIIKTAQDVPDLYYSTGFMHD